MDDSNKDIKTPLVSGIYRLEKFPGKGGWVFAALPELSNNKRAVFGWLTVRGRIDNYALRQYKLMPMGNGQLFLPVKAEIRKKIGKDQGDEVEIILYLDNSKYEVPKEILDCLNMEEKGLAMRFMSWPEGKQKRMVDWIDQAKTAETKTRRILALINDLLNA